MRTRAAHLRTVDEICDRFERAWKQGEASLEEALAEAPPECRGRLLGELAGIEIHYRRNATGNPLQWSDLAAVHPDLTEELQRLAHSQSETQLAQSAQSDGALPTRVHSGGLRVKCPHCSNRVELLAESPDQQITCQSCGSGFSLMGDGREGEAAAAPRIIGRFELVSRLGTGGFGSVWKARDRDLHRTVALKTPRRGNLRREEIEYFFREARAAAQLQHPNIAAVHEIGKEDDVVFIVSDLIDGVTLSAWIAETRRSPREIAALCATIADALHHAHEHGVIHRDLKPSNVMIDRQGSPRILDFGLARREAGEATMTLDGQVLGTAAYMSPEQAAGKSHWTDRRTDVYSLGVILFQMLTGELPFRGNLETQLVAKQMNDAPDPRKLNRHVPDDAATICLKCLERDPNGRYPTAAAVADELRRYLRGEPIQARPISTLRRGWRWAKRRPALATALSLAAFLAIAGPAAAVALHVQKQRILQQNDELIQTVAQERQIHQGLADDLRFRDAEIDALRGRVPGVEQLAPGWQRTLVEQVLDAHYSDPSWQRPGEDADAVRFHLGLGFLYAEVGRKDEAMEQFRSAQATLESLLQRQPDQPRLLKALAECNAELAKLTGDRSAAKRVLRLRQRVAASQPDDVSALVDLAVAEWQPFSEDESQADAPGKLAAIAETLERIVAQWPVEPGAIYKAACRLTLREPVLD